MSIMPKPFGSSVETGVDRREANARAIAGLTDSEPVLTGIRAAGEVIEGFERNMVFTSGPTLPWDQYRGGQRRAILGGVLYEGLASNEEEAEKLLAGGDIVVSTGHAHGCVGSLAGVTTWSMPVVVVEDGASGGRGYCTLYEGDAVDRLNYGTYSSATQANLTRLETEIAPLLDRLVQSRSSGIPLLPIMTKAAAMGDELHSRNTAATLLFIRECLDGFADLTPAETRTVVEYFNSGDYLFLRLSMAASKVMADRMVGVPGSSVVTAMGFSCREFGIQVSAYPGRWFRGPLPTFEHQKIFPPHTAEDIEFMGGESVITEVCGLGANALAAALPLQRSSGGSTKALVDMAHQMYSITATEHPDVRIPVLDYRGSPLGIDVDKVMETGTTPLLDIGIAGRSGSQIGGGVARAPMEPFRAAREQLDRDR